MKSVRTLVALLAVAAIVFGGWRAANTKADDPKKDPPPDPKAKGQLRMHWKQLGLGDDQVQKIYKVQADYKAKIDTLEAQVKALKEEQYAKEVEVLTADQKKHLAELDAFKDPTKPDDKKPDDKKPDDKKPEDKKDPNKP
jgi:Spy/CpxP family protein refolding chaperone